MQNSIPFILKPQLSFSPSLLHNRSVYCKDLSPHSQIPNLQSLYPVSHSQFLNISSCFPSTPFSIFSVLRQSMCCCLSWATCKVIGWPVKVLLGYLAAREEEVFNHSVIQLFCKITGVQADKILYKISCELVEKMRSECSCSSKVNPYFDKDYVSSVHLHSLPPSPYKYFSY